MGGTIGAIILQVLLCRSSSHRTPRNSQKIHHSSQELGEIAKTPIKTPRNSHWATDYFRRPFFMRNFANMIGENRLHLSNSIELDCIRFALSLLLNY